MFIQARGIPGSAVRGGDAWHGTRRRQAAAGKPRYPRQTEAGGRVVAGSAAGALGSSRWRAGGGAETREIIAPPAAGARCAFDK